eukprot:TCONS_00014748-protein
MHALAAGSIGNSELPRRYRTSRFNLNVSSPQGSVASEQKNTGKPKIVINISGMIFETYASTLNKYPDTLLGTPLKRSLITDRRTKQIYLERNRNSFDAILFYYQSSGCLIRPSNVSMIDFEEECAYFDLPQDAVKRMKCRDGFLHKRETKLPGYKYYRDFQYTLWQFFEFPKEFKNRSAMVYFVFSFALIFASIAIFCVESEILLLNWKSARLKEYYYIQQSIELALNVYFAMELLARFFATPIKKRFFEKILNNIEITSVILFLGAIWLPSHFVTKWAINLSRILRAFRISRLARMSAMIKTSILVFKSSVNDILAVWFTILIICVLCGSTMYYVEMSEPGTNFTSIPMSMWWAMQTVLCLGYGDIVPTSVPGKIIGAAMLYYGVVTVMVLVLALGSRFFDMYAKFLNKDSWLPEENNKEQDLSFP